MARAETIWIVLDCGCGTKVMKAFTVKRELKTWLARQTEDELVGLEIWRVDDGLCPVNLRRVGLDGELVK